MSDSVVCREEIQGVCVCGCVVACPICAYKETLEDVSCVPCYPSLLTTAEQVQRLNPNEAARLHPVTIRGVVTGQIPAGPGIVIQDSTRGIYVDCSALGGLGPRRSWRT